MVDGDAIDGDQCAFGFLPKRACKIKNVFDSGWVGVAVADGRDLRETVWSLNVEKEGVTLCELGDGAVEPAVGVIGSKDTSLSVIPPFLE